MLDKPKPKKPLTSLTAAARLEGPWGSMSLSKDQLTGTLVVASHEDPDHVWAGEGGPYAVFPIPDNCPVVPLEPGTLKPKLKFPNAFLDFLLAHPEFAPKWAREANAVFFYEMTPPPNHACGARQVRGLSFASGSAKIEVRLDRAFGPHDRIARLESDEPMRYEIIDAP